MAVEKGAKATVRAANTETAETVKGMAAIAKAARAALRVRAAVTEDKY